jgi:hypothetical protein
MVDVAVLSSPLALFPVDLYRKFGFHPPVGVFLDLSSGFAVEKALGEAAFQAYRGHFQTLDPPASQMDWYNDLPDLKNQDLLATWQEEVPGDKPDHSLEEKIVLRACLLKAKMRAMLWGVSYQRNAIQMPDITELIRNIKEALPDPQSSAGN